MNTRTILLSGALLGLTGVALGAFGAHALKPVLSAGNRLDTFELAVRYQFYHGFALLITGLLAERRPGSRRLPQAAWCFLIGTFFFSGSLYVLCFTGLGILGAITPIGGTLFIIGWMLLISGTARKQQEPS